MTKGSVKDFIAVVHTLVPDINKLILKFGAISLVHEIIKIIPVFLVKYLIDAISHQATFMQILPLIIACLSI